MRYGLPAKARPGGVHMNRILIPTLGATDWRKLLADPDKHWVRGRSAFETAVSWERAQRSERGIPPEVAAALDEHRGLAGARLLVALPEHKVKLVGPGKASQNDVWALLRSDAGLISMSVEGKAGESFASTIGEWLQEASEAKKARLEHLCRVLQLEHPPGPALRYQLFHRTASALIEAGRFGATQAVMVVQSFQEDPRSWDDFASFCGQFASTPAPGKMVEIERTTGPRLYVGWVSCPVATDEVIASVV
jgi:hypothetical protein